MTSASTLSPETLVNPLNVRTRGSSDDAEAPFTSAPPSAAAAAPLTFAPPSAAAAATADDAVPETATAATGPGVVF